MSNHQGDEINRAASRASEDRIRAAEDARMNAENAAAAARARQSSGR